MRLARLFLLATAGILAGCPPASPTPEPSPDPSPILYSYGLFWMSSGNWDLPAEAGATVRAYSYGRHPTTLTLKSAGLYRATDLTTPLATLALAVQTPQLDFAGEDAESVTLVNDGTINRDLANACGPVQVVMVFHSSSCDCEVRAQGSDFVRCYADNGADPELAAVGEPAPPGRPCGLRSFTTEGGTESLDTRKAYRYDAEGRLLFADEFDEAGTYLSRTYFTYEGGPLLRERERISPVARAVSERTSYGYAGGVLATIARDGDASAPPDGTPDATLTYGFDGNAWTESGGAAAKTYTYDPMALTVTRSDAVFHLAAPISEPSRFFATTTLDMPRISSSEHSQGGVSMTLTYVYSGDTLLEVRSSEVLGFSFRDEYLYSCP